ncbi:DUF1329 domain-containing protein [Solimonas aquatica]|nr:DUF1329 domain-containing protein [Solimonas aquatica]
MIAAAAMLACGSATAAVSADEAAKLGNTLTPVGAEKAGNAAGTIPAWTPLTQHPAASLKGEYTSDAAIDAEKPVLTITKANMAQYADKLSEGHKYLLKTFDSYKMNIYPSHRQVAWPAEIYKATAVNATKCQLLGVDNPDGCSLGFPFPIPKSGAEVIWNHKLKFRGEAATRYNNQMIVQPDGTFQFTNIVEDVKFYYGSIAKPVPLTKDAGLFIKYFSKIQGPPRLAGTLILVHERAGAGPEGRQAWLYAPALKRIRRAPTVCCDNPAEGTDGHQFYDQVDMFNGILDRYTWKIVGKKEMYIPNNSNLIAGPKTKYKDIVRPKHLNQDLPRYELHRTWVVDADLRAGTNHTFRKRRFYLDEDGWQIVAVDCYDANGNLFRFQEGHMVALANVLGSGTLPEVIYHFDTGRYFITALANEDQPNDYTRQFDESYFDPDAVQKRANK